MSRPRRIGSIGEFITNMDADMPLPRKLFLLARNVSIRVVKVQDCCGHEGEPGC